MSERDRKFPILMYHEVYRPGDRDLLRSLTNPAYNTELDRFRRQMEWICSAKMRTLTIDELLTDGPSVERQVICLTFDDGWLGNYSNAYPILKEYGLKATFFVATNLIGKAYYMTWNQLKEIQASGMAVQSHTVTHRPLGDMEEKEVRFELQESKGIIEEKLNTKVSHLSLPHGSKNGETWPIAEELGYKTICTSNVGFQPWESNGPWIKRIAIGDQISEKKFASIAEAKNGALWTMKPSKGLRNGLKRMIGNDNYRRFYQWFYGLRRDSRER